MRQHGYLSGRTPVAAGPNGVVGIALFELDPDTRADGWNGEDSHLNSADGQGRHGPTGGHEVRYVGYDDLNPANLERVNVVDHRAAILAIEPMTAQGAFDHAAQTECGSAAFTHAGTLEKVEMSPLRAAVKLCLNSPRLMLWVTLLMKYKPSNARPAPRIPMSRRGLSTWP